MIDMAELTKEDFDGIFQAFKDDSFVDEMRNEAKQLLKVAEKSDHFKAVTTMWLKDSLSTVTGAGIEPRKLGAMVLVCFLLGVKHQKSVSGGLDMDAVNRFLMGLEKDDAKGA